MYDSNKNDCAQCTIVISKRNINIKNNNLLLIKHVYLINISNYSGER